MSYWIAQNDIKIMDLAIRSYLLNGYSFHYDILSFIVEFKICQYDSLC